MLVTACVKRTAWLAMIGLAAIGGGLVAPGVAEAKIPGTVHCYNDICHRIRTVAETETRVGVIEPVVASFYDSPENDSYNPSLMTSSGTEFDPDAPDNAASPIHPDGTILLVWSPATRGAAVLRVNNAGPYHPGRTLDVSRAVAERIGFVRGGTMNLFSVVISAPAEHEAHYVRGRVYPKVRGYLGKYDNLALASLAEPAARAALFRGNAPLHPLAFGPSAQTTTAPAESRAKPAPRDDANRSSSKLHPPQTARPEHPLVKVASLKPPRDDGEPVSQRRRNDARPAHARLGRRDAEDVMFDKPQKVSAFFAHRTTENF